MKATVSARQIFKSASLSSLAAILARVKAIFGGQFLQLGQVYNNIAASEIQYKKLNHLKGSTIQEAEEKYLGIIITQDMKPKRHIAETVKKANKILGMIRRAITCKNIQNIMNFYKTLVKTYPRLWISNLESHQND